LIIICFSATISAWLQFPGKILNLRGAFGPIFILSSGNFNFRDSFHYGGGVECIPKTHPFEIPAPVI
jgi:hypothetical protein